MKPFVLAALLLALIGMSVQAMDYQTSEIGRSFGVGGYFVLEEAVYDTGWTETVTEKVAGCCDNCYTSYQDDHGGKVTETKLWWRNNRSEQIKVAAYMSVPGGGQRKYFTAPVAGNSWVKIPLGQDGWKSGETRKVTLKQGSREIGSITVAYRRSVQNYY